MLTKAVKMQHVSDGCFVCGISNEASTRAKFYELEDRSVIATVTARSIHQSYPGTVHGGVSSALLDETIGRAIYANEENCTGCTVELVTRYWKPVPYDTSLLVMGRITEIFDRKFYGEGAILLTDGTILATAVGKYVKLSNDTLAMFQVENTTMHFLEENPDIEFDLPDDIWEQIRTKHEHKKEVCSK